MAKVIFQPKRINFLLFILLTLTAACAMQPQTVEITREVNRLSAPASDGILGVLDMDTAGGAAGETTNSAPQEPPQAPQPNANAQAQERLIIRTADLSLIVTDTEESITAVTQIANGRGGWVVNSSTYQSGETLRGDMTIRIPAEDFDAILTQIKDSAIEVTRESITGQDVTEEYVDLSARLGNLEATADRVRSFLDETENVEEALQVNVELSRLEGDIEAIKGRLQYLSQSAAFSTITINFRPDTLSGEIQVAGWRPQGIARNAIEALLGTLQLIGSIGIWLVLYILPLLLLLGLPLYFIIRWFIRRRRARRTASVETTAPSD